jgi:hypothetical protein
MAQITPDATLTAQPGTLGAQLEAGDGDEDDFVDFMAHIGMGLGLQVAASPAAEKEKGPVTGTLAWVKHSANMRAWSENRLKNFWS